MKIKTICKLPTEIPIALGIGLAGLLVVIGAYYWLSFVATIYGAAIIAAGIAAGSGLLAAIVGNVNLIIIGLVALLSAVVGWFGEETHKGEGQWKRSVEILFAMIISAIFSLYPALILSMMAFSWPIFVEGIIVLTGGFIAGWLLHWCKRCIRIEPDGEAPAGGENL